MLGLLPALWIAACVAVIGASHHRSARPSLRDTIVLALLGAGAWSTVGGELLSLGAHLTFWPVLAWWGLPTIGMGAIAFSRREALRGWVFRQSAPPQPVHPLTVSPSHPPGPDRVTRSLIAVTAGLLLATGLIALLTPPNTWDAAGYHMPRQLYWMQQGSLAHYNANDLRQLEFPPMLESAGVQVMILAGDDRLANMVSWAAFLGCVLVVSIIARDLGGSARSQALAALLVCTCPALLNYAVNVKNTPLLGFWACLLAWFALRIWIEQVCGPARAALVGTALGLLLYTHGVGYLFALPLGVLLAVWMLGRLRWRAIPAAILIALVAAGLNAGHWWRNYDAFGHPLGRSMAGRGYNLTNDTFVPGAMISGVVRNLALHTPTPSARVNAAQDRVIARLHAALGIGASDPRTTTPPKQVFSVRWAFAEDGHGGAPIHLLLAAAAPIALAADPRYRRSGAAWALLGAACAMFLLFCLVLKWQPWHARFHMPAFALLAPVLGLLLPRAPGALVKGVLILGAIGLGAAALLCNVSKPVLGERSVLLQTREETLFQHIPAVRDAMRSIIAEAGGFRPRVVGVSTGDESFEYPMQRLILDHLEPPPKIVAAFRDIGPAPPLGWGGASDPEIVLAWESTDALMEFRPGAAAYVPVAQSLPITLYAREDLVRTRRRDIEERMPFSGWRPLEGLGPPLGRMPQWNMPVVVRCGTGLRTRLRFDGIGQGAEAELVFECRRGPSPDQTLEVYLNGEQVYRYELGPARVFTSHRVPLRPRGGPNEVEIRYTKTDRVPSGEERAVHYARLQVIQRPPGAPRP